MPGYLILTGFLILYSAEDLKTGRISLVRILAGAVAGAAYSFVCREILPAGILAGLAVGGVFCLLALLSGGGVGLGDGLVMMVCGLFTGVREVMSILCLSLCAGLVPALYLTLVKKEGKRKSFPFVPCILVSVLVHLTAEILEVIS